MKKIIAIGFALVLLLQAAALAEIPCAYYSEHGDHDWEQVDVQMPTCTADGQYTLKCKVCGVSKVEKSVEAYGHDWQPTGNSEPATCVKEGWVEVRCENCGAVSKMILTLAAHQWAVKSETKSTCAVKGVKVEECTVCGKTRTTESPLLPHVFNDWTVSRQPTDHSQGERVRTCQVCYKSETEYFYPDGTLVRGGPRGDAVKALQTKLIAMGFLHDVADGIFGKNTEQAVKQFQQAEGLSADGIAWPQTLTAVNNRYQRTVLAAPTATPQPTPVPQVNVTVPDVVVVSGSHANMSDGEGCVYWAEGIGFEYVSCCEKHAAMVEKTLRALAYTDAAQRAYMTKTSANAWNSALEAEYAAWAAEDPANAAAIEAARDAYRALSEAHAPLFAANAEDSVKWRLFTAMLECTRLCAQLNEAGE